MSAYVDAALHASVGSQPVSTAVSNLSQKNEQMILRGSGSGSGRGFPRIG